MHCNGAVARFAAHRRAHAPPLAPMTVSILPDAGQLNAIMRNIATHLDGPRQESDGFQPIGSA